MRETRESGKRDFEVGTYITLSVSMEDKNGINTTSRSGGHILHVYALRCVTRESVQVVLFLASKGYGRYTQHPSPSHCVPCCLLRSCARDAMRRVNLFLAIDSALERLNLHWFIAVVFF